jgi:RNA polymerase primary sigma factor
MESLSRIFSKTRQSTNEAGIDSLNLNLNEIRLIADGKIEKLTDFISSYRLHATDTKGDTPLHIAARIGNLALCDFFIRAGADATRLNHDQKTASQVAFAEGHIFVGQLLSSILSSKLEFDSFENNEEISDIKKFRIHDLEIVEHQLEEIQKIKLNNLNDDLNDQLNFKPELEPESFLSTQTLHKASGTFLTLSSLISEDFIDKDTDWHVELSNSPIAGDGIGSAVPSNYDHNSEHDFLKVRNRGRQSFKRTTVQTGTKLSIQPISCITFAHEALEKGSCSSSEVNRIAELCEGNGDIDEIRINLKRTLEAAGLECADLASGDEIGLWDALTDISSDELAEAIEGTLTRATVLPGTHRFVMDKSEEEALLEPMVRTKQELLLGILTSEAAVEKIIDTLDGIWSGSIEPNALSLKTILPLRPEHQETAEVINATKILKYWHTNGRVMDGKRRREALEALEALDLSLTFHKELVNFLKNKEENYRYSHRLDDLIRAYEASNHNLIIRHLPYARRFAARNVREGEDTEDVFQVAFMGLQRSTRRFDPERNNKFIVYCTIWMQQTLQRWRADEGAIIRIPSHRRENITKLNLTLNRLDIWSDGLVSNDELAIKLAWTEEEVRQFRSIPQEPYYPDYLDDWDLLLPAYEEVNIFEEKQIELIIADALAKLPDRQADVIRKRFGIGHDMEMTLEEIGQIYGVTRERIRQIEAKALTNLKHPALKRQLKILSGR